MHRQSTLAPVRRPRDTFGFLQNAMMSFFPCMIEHIRDPKTQLEGIAMGTLHGDAKAHPQHGSGPVEPLPICFAH
jgi:hypothetical protein